MELSDHMTKQICKHAQVRNMTLKRIADQSVPEREEFVNVLVEEFGKPYTGLYNFRISPSGVVPKERKNEAKEHIENFRQFIHPDWVRAAASDDELFEAPDFTSWDFNERVTLLSSPGGQPDCIVGGHVNFTTKPSLGLGLDMEKVTVRIDVREVLCCLSVPQEIAKRHGGKEIGYQNVAGSPNEPEGFPIDFYSRNLVLAFAARDSKVAKNAVTNMVKVTDRAITYPGIIQAQFGLAMSYAPPPTPVGKQVAVLIVQLVSIAAEAIPVIGPVMTFTISFAGNSIIDSTWPSQFESSVPAVFSLIYSQKGNIAKYVGKGYTKLNLKLK